MRNIIDRFKLKIKEKNGETIAETLVAMLITVLALMLLPGAIVAAARVNSRVEDMTTYVNTTDTSKNTEVSGAAGIIELDTGGITSSKITVSNTYKKYTEKTSGKSIYYYE